MSVHAEHTSLDGYHPEQLLHDGCDECEYRGERVHVAIANLDAERFEHAWRRAGEMQLHGLINCSHTERPMLQALAMVQIQLERRGIPLGLCPSVHLGR